VTYIHLVDVEDLPESYCEVAQPYNLLGLRKYSIPVACVPLVYKAGERKWVVTGTRNLHYYRKADSLAEALEEAAQGWPHWCRWRDLPHGGTPPGVYDVDLLAEALERMPVFRPKPEDLAVDFVVWSYGHDLTDFLRSEFVVYTRAKRTSEKWREICPHGDPRECYQGAVGEWLADVRARGLTPAVDSALFGKRFARPWGVAPVYLRTERGATRIYYVLGHLLREVLPRIQMLKRQSSEWEIPQLIVDEAVDVQGPLLRQIRRRRPEPLAPIAPLEDFPTSNSQVERGGPFAAFDLLDL